MSNIYKPVGGRQAETFSARLQYCAAMLYAYDVLTEKERDRVRGRIEKQVRAAAIHSIPSAAAPAQQSVPPREPSEAK